jgi:3-deoxy-D-manno-octulosonate 8-phosphate phosphatase KdsC-like HAD superfamily phosphatase
MRRSGVTFAPADAVEGIRSVVDCITHLPGGYGAVREVCDLIIWSKKEHA